METDNLMEEPRRCTATSKQSGERCKRRPHPGSNVCVIHGAGAPQTKRTARERLEALVDPAVNTLRKVLQHGLDTGNTPSAVRAALGILDRCGFHPSQCVELTGEGGGPVGVGVFHSDRLSVEEKVALVELLERAGVTFNPELW
jgi:hypothetical protein